MITQTIYNLSHEIEKHRSYSFPGIRQRLLEWLTHRTLQILCDLFTFSFFVLVLLHEGLFLL